MNEKKLSEIAPNSLQKNIWHTESIKNKCLGAVLDNSITRGLVLLGIFLAIGMSLAAFIFGVQAKHIGSAKQSITVKGLAEHAIKATRAEWHISIGSHADNQQLTLNKLRSERVALNQFLSSYGFESENFYQSSESIEPNTIYETNQYGRNVEVQRGYNGRQTLTVKTEDLTKVQDARAKIVEFKAQGHSVNGENLEFLVGNLDEIKLSLIGAATKNAKARALEFAKNGDVKVGVMRAASQGTFDILSANNAADDDSYGGSYDKSSVDKIARVVVTIEYEIEK